MTIDIPSRIFLDTTVVNFTLDWGEAIFDGGRIPIKLPQRTEKDIRALQAIFLAGKRANWQLVVSPKTYEEIARTRDGDKRTRLETWFNEIWIYRREFVEDTGLCDQDATAFTRRLERLQFLAAFPDRPDRELIGQAIAFECDTFCTRDWRTILRHRGELNRAIRLRLITPTEWWEKLAPYAALWV